MSTNPEELMFVFQLFVDRATRPPLADLEFQIIRYVTDVFRTPLGIRRPSTELLERAPKKQRTTREDQLPPPIPFELDD